MITSWSQRLLYHREQYRGKKFSGTCKLWRVNGALETRLRIAARIRGRGRGRGRGRAGGGRGRGSSSRDEGCFLCGNKEHFARNCPQRQTTEKEGSAKDDKAREAQDENSDNVYESGRFVVEVEERSRPTSDTSFISVRQLVFGLGYINPCNRGQTFNMCMYQAR